MGVACGGGGVAGEAACEKGSRGVGGGGTWLRASPRSTLGASESRQSSEAFGLVGIWSTLGQPCPLPAPRWGPLHSFSLAGQVWFPSHSGLSPLFLSLGVGGGT